MIIRLTVKDNDFSEVLENYLSRFFINIEKTQDLTIDNSLDIMKMHKKINAMLNPNMDYTLTLEDKEFLIQQVKDSFAYWCGSRYPDDVDYLTKNLQVSILDSMRDKWENGEACYWFQHSGIVINQ